MPEHSGVEFRDIASGKVSRQVTGPFDCLTEGPFPLPGRPCRAFAVASGAVTYTGLDGVNVTTPDMGGAWQWDIQAIAIVSGDVQVIW